MQSVRDERPPNIVIVYADDMGYGDLGAQNSESKIPTPHLDRLASEGLRCTDAHSSSGICTPSRLALLTGRYHWRRLHEFVDSFEPSVLRAEDVTLPELLRGVGYDTACIGKWHLGWDWSALRRDGAKPDPKTGYAPGDFDWTRAIPDGPLAHGFDHYFGDDVPNFPPYGWIEDDRLPVAPTVPLAVAPAPTEGSAESRPGPMVAGWRQDRVMPTLTEHTLEWLRAPRRQERPFFLYFAWTAPHAPISPTEDFQGATEAGGYGDFVRQCDQHLGALLDALDQLDLARNTLIVFTADNGPEAYAYARVRERGHRSAGSLRGVKRDVFEGGHRVPFLVRWPGVVPAGSTSDALLGQIDLLPTLAHAAGADAPTRAQRADGAAPSGWKGALDGVDQLSVWRGEATSARMSLVHNTYADVWALRSGPFVFIDAPRGTHNRIPAWYPEFDGLPTEDTPALLFDLASDLGQRANLYESRPELVTAMRAALNAARTP